VRSPEDRSGRPRTLDRDNLIRKNGRGILFMKKFMDRIHYGSGPGGGTMVTLRKRVGPKTDTPHHSEEGAE